MTNEEAIATLKLGKERTIESVQRRADVGFPPDRQQLDYIDALNMAIEVLDKHTPKKPLINGDINPTWNKEAHICPKCFNYVGWGNYCSHCAQAIDWSEK